MSQFSKLAAIELAEIHEDVKIEVKMSRLAEYQEKVRSSRGDSSRSNETINITKIKIVGHRN